MIPMKKIYIMLAAFALAVCSLTSCVNPAVEEYGTINVTAKLSSIVSGFQLYNSDDLDLPNSTIVQLRCLVYGSDGNRFAESNFNLSSFVGTEQNVSFKAKVGEPYTIILFASCISGSEHAFSFSGLESMSSINIEQKYWRGYDGFSVLGFAERTVRVGESVEINMEPMTSMVYIQYDNIHAHDKDVDAIDKYQMWCHLNDIITCDGGKFNFHTSLGANQYFTDTVEPAEFGLYRFAYSVTNILPGNFPTFARAYIGNEYTDTAKQNINIVSGHQYVLTLDCKSFSLSFKEGPMTN